MIDFLIHIASLTISVAVNFESTEEYCKDFICDSEPDISVEITPSDIEYEREQFIRVSENEKGLSSVRPDSYLEIIALQRKITEALLAHNTLLFHGSAVAVDGKAYLFTAKSGTGKSTHTRLWREMFGDRAVMVNDDKPFISVKDGQVIVHGSPWQGKHKLGSNISVPLCSICILDRCDKNSIEQISASKVLPMLIQQSSRPRTLQLMPKYMELLNEIAEGVRFYHLYCNTESEAARISYTGMSGKQ